MLAGTTPWNRAMVTGASSGIGRDLCELLADSGTDLVVVARRQELLDDLADRLDVNVEILCADLSNQQDLDRVADRVAAEEKPIDLLVNNAGFSHFGAFCDLELEQTQDIIKVNIGALHALCYHAATAMRTRKRGWILNVSSIASFAPYPRSATYGGTKAFVTNFSEALQAELAPDGIVVSALCPGPVRTDFHKQADIDLDVMPDTLVMESKEVAQVALEDLAKRKAVIIPGIPMKLTRLFIRVMPSTVIRRISDRISSKR